MSAVTTAAAAAEIRGYGFSAADAAYTVCIAVTRCQYAYIVYVNSGICFITLKYTSAIGTYGIKTYEPTPKPFWIEALAISLRGTR